MFKFWKKKEEKTEVPSDPWIWSERAAENEQQIEAYKKASSDPDEENVIKVWKGSGTAPWFRKRHFDGYTQYETLEADGKTVLHNVYTGVYYTPELEKKEIVQHRITYALLILAGLALILFSSTRVITANTRAFNGIPQGFTFMAFGCSAYGLINDLIVPKRRTIGDYRSSSLFLKYGGLVASITTALSALITLIYLLIGVNKIGLHVVALLGELAASAAGFLIWKIESKVKYTETVSKLAGKYNM